MARYHTLKGTQMPDTSARFAITGGACNLLAFLRHEDRFYAIELEAIDAPLFLPAGGAHRHEYEDFITKEPRISPQGIVVARDGAFV